MAELVGGIAGSLQGKAMGLVNQGQSFIDRYFPPERRAEVWATVQKFINEKPLLSSFLLSHIALSGVPIGLFFLLTISVGVFALLAALLVGLLGALFFIVFATGVALIFVLPALFFTTLVATFLWLWGMGTYYIIKTFNEKEIPGIHKPLLGGGADSQTSENDRLGALNPDPSAASASAGSGSSQHRSASASKGSKSGSANGHASTKANGGGADASLEKLGQATGVDPGNVGELKKKLNASSVDELRKKADTHSLDDLKKGISVGGVA